jgi:hypothetical protein
MIHRFSAFSKLVELGKMFIEQPHALHYVSEDFLSDLLVWYHLAWLGETVRRGDSRVKALMDKEHHYTMHERRELMTIIGDILSGLLPRYRALAEAGRVELSFTLCPPDRTVATRHPVRQ